jgi:hypothetical protein
MFATFSNRVGAFTSAALIYFLRSGAMGGDDRPSPAEGYGSAAGSAPLRISIQACVRHLASWSANANRRRAIPGKIRGPGTVVSISRPAWKLITAIPRYYSTAHRIIHNIIELIRQDFGETY